MNATETKDAYLVEKCGDFRSVFGPYHRFAAQQRAGSRYMVVRGETLEGRVKITGDALATLINIGSVTVL
jgi:hypothetical protein